MKEFPSTARRQGRTPNHQRAGRLALPLIAGVVALSGCSDGATPNRPTPISATSGTDGYLAASASLTFDALGGGSTIIQVYPGVEDTPTDRRPNGTYRDGEVVTAECKTISRIVVSNTDVGEQPGQSDVWIRIDGIPGVTQYATMTYADMDPAALASLQNCEK